MEVKNPVQDDMNSSTTSTSMQCESSNKALSAADGDDDYNQPIDGSSLTDGMAGNYHTTDEEGQQDLLPQSSSTTTSILSQNDGQQIEAEPHRHRTIQNAQNDSEEIESPQRTVIPLEVDEPLSKSSHQKQRTSSSTSSSFITTYYRKYNWTIPVFLGILISYCMVSQILRPYEVRVERRSRPMHQRRVFDNLDIMNILSFPSFSSKELRKESGGKNDSTRKRDRDLENEEGEGNEQQQDDGEEEEEKEEGDDQVEEDDAVVVNDDGANDDIYYNATNGNQTYYAYDDDDDYEGKHHHYFKTI